MSEALIVISVLAACYPLSWFIIYLCDRVWEHHLSVMQRNSTNKVETDRD
jgi:hypothetical protein